MKGRSKRHWYAIYLDLKPKLAAEGVERRNALIRESANEALYHPKVFGRMVKAGEFLDSIKKNCPIEDVSCGYVHLEILEQIYHIDLATGESLLEDVLANKKSLKDLQTTRDNLLGQAVQKKVHRSYARKKVIAFDALCYSALSKIDLKLFGHTHGELIKVTRSKLFKPFYMILWRNGRKTAIFTRQGDIAGYADDAMRELIPAVTHAKFHFDEIWFLFGKNSPLIQPFSQLAHYLDPSSDWLFLASIDENAEIQPLTILKLGYAFEYDMSGISPFAWEGMSLTTGEKVVGDLEPLVKKTVEEGSSC